MAKNQTITVIIAAWNAADYIEGAIASALGQTCAPDVIIVDDASTDGTPDRVREIIVGEPRASLIVQQVNQGPSAARNRAISAARTDWVTPLDADDTMVPDRLETLLAKAIGQGWDAIGDDQYRVSASGERRRLWSDEDFGEIELTLARFVRENIADNCGFGRELGYIKPLMRKRFLDRQGLAYTPSMRLGEDYDLYGRILANGGRFGLVDPAGYFAHELPGSLSRQHASEAFGAFVEADRRLLNMPGLSEEARSEINAHMLMTQKKWADAALSEAWKDRNVALALSCLAVPLPVLAHVGGRVAAGVRKRLAQAQS